MPRSGHITLFGSLYITYPTFPHERVISVNEIISSRYAGHLCETSLIAGTLEPLGDSPKLLVIDLKQA